LAAVIRIGDAIAKEARDVAHRSGITLTRFVEDSLRMRLGRRPRIEDLPVFDSGIRLPMGFDLKALIRDEPG
jgi:hypothetical protein